MTSARDRRGRGMRGPAFAPPQADQYWRIGGRPILAPMGVPARRTPAQRFDRIALGIMRELWARFPNELARLELGVEEVPMIPERWSPDTIPLASYSEAKGGQPPRLVLLRRPIERRALSRGDLEALVFTVLVEQVAEILGIRPDQVHPDYTDD